MDINKVLLEYDNMFGVHSLEEIDDFLTGKLDEAYEEQDLFSATTLLNELMGFCRDNGYNERGIKYCQQTLDLMERMNLQGTVEYATSLINVANAYRAFGLLRDSLMTYERAEEIYLEKLAPNEFNYASLYNNWALLYQETGEFENAEKMLRKALAVVERFPNAIMEQATTKSNLAVSLLRISKNEEEEEKALQIYGQALEYLRQALDIYERDGSRDFHYSAALSAMGDALYMKEDFARAAEYYHKAMIELEKHVGKTEAYERVEENYNQSLARSKAENERQAGIHEEAKNGFSDENKQTIEATDGEGVNAEKTAGEEVNNLQASADKKSTNVQKSVEKESEDDGKYFAGLIKNPHILNNNLERCRAFYREYGVPMIHKKFPEYEGRIAVGLVGEGSDCFGFDDYISADHDYGVGFCMWLTDEDYEAISTRLQEEYDKLVLKHGREYYEVVGITGQESRSFFIDGRRGVFRISSFYGGILGEDVGSQPLSEKMWMRISEEKLATAVNGKVFRDDLGKFTAIRRNLLAYYPERVWRLKLAEQLYHFSQNAQSNYARMMARQDYVTADLCIAQANKSAMAIVYLLNRRYAPYYKWMRRGMNKLEHLTEAAAILDGIAMSRNQDFAWEEKRYSPYEINMKDKVLAAFEALAALILSEMNSQGIVDGSDTFLDIYSKQLIAEAGNAQGASVSTDRSGDEEALHRNEENDMAEEMTKEQLIESIVKAEWEQFDKVKNEGGRADCQDDWNTFSLMRKSQYLSWNKDLLASFYKDLIEAQNKGWNLIMEKYARMMESTAPERYAELKDELPERSEERIAIQEEIVKIQVEWMEEFAEKYPKMAGNARSIHTSEDNPYNTSYETYLRGELGTYSEDTLLLYGWFIVGLKQEEENLAYIIMDNTAKLYGYTSVEDAEGRL